MPMRDYYLTLSSAQSVLIPPGHYKTTVYATVGTDRIGQAVDDLFVYPTGQTAGTPSVSPVSGPSAATLGLVSTLYCTDEDIARKCGPDLVSLMLPSSILAQGSDGVFQTADPWTLVSGSNNFAIQGVAVGNVIQLRKPAAAFGGQGMTMAVSAVSGASLTLRHIGLPANTGMAPAPAAGLIGVDFSIGTFAPQIEEATYALNQRYNIDPTISGRMPTDLKDIRPLRRACVAMVLIDRYSDESRASVGNYADKLAALKADLGELRSSLELRWSIRDSGMSRTNWFSTRIVR